MKQVIWMGMLLGSTIGGFIPTLWGAGFLSFSSLIFSTLGAMAGIYITYKLTH
jgi:uncharacterized membrane protein YeaQ/YmgE (transglycosylase-associated protein family)